MKIFISKKTKTSTCKWLDISAAATSTFAIEKAKTFKDILDKKAPSTATFALVFL